MGQKEVITYLEKCEKPQSRQQIARAIGWTPTRVTKILRVLLKWKDIQFIEYSQEEAQELVTYKLMRRTRFYFVDSE